MWKTINSQNEVEFFNILSLWVEKGWTSISSIPYIVGKLMCWIRRAFRRTKKRGQRTMGLWGKKSGLDWARNFRRRGFHLAWMLQRWPCNSSRLLAVELRSFRQLSIYSAAGAGWVWAAWCPRTIPAFCLCCWTRSNFESRRRSSSLYLLTGSAPWGTINEIQMQRGIQIWMQMRIQI